DGCLVSPGTDDGHRGTVRPGRGQRRLQRPVRDDAPGGVSRYGGGCLPGQGGGEWRVGRGGGGRETPPPTPPHPPPNALRDPTRRLILSPPASAFARRTLLSSNSPSSMTFSSRAVTMILYRRSQRAMKPCNAGTTTASLGDGRYSHERTRQDRCIPAGR